MAFNRVALELNALRTLLAYYGLDHVRGGLAIRNAEAWLKAGGLSQYSNQDFDVASSLYSIRTSLLDWSQTK